MSVSVVLMFCLVCTPPGFTGFSDGGGYPGHGRAGVL